VSAIAKTAPEPEAARAQAEPDTPETEAPAAPSPASAAPSPPVPATEPAPAPPKPAGPPPLSPSFSVSAKIADLEVLGGISRNRSGVALERVIGDAQACLRAPLAKKGVESSGSVWFEGEVTTRGRLKKLSANGAHLGAQACLIEVFSKARLPRPDTGNGRVRFKLSYRTVQ